MTQRGPKPKTARNAPSKAKGIIRHPKLEPTSELNPEALVEFRRLCCVLLDRGTMERVDLAVLTECARITDLLDRSHQMLAALVDPKAVSVVSQLTSQRRGLLRELGLTLQPSRSVVHTNARDNKKAKDESAVASYLKLNA